MQSRGATCDSIYIEVTKKDFGLYGARLKIEVLSRVTPRMKFCIPAKIILHKSHYSMLVRFVPFPILLLDQYH